MVRSGSMTIWHSGGNYYDFAVAGYSKHNQATRYNNLLRASSNYNLARGVRAM